MRNIIYKKPPLAFSGNKKNQLKNFIEVLEIFEHSHWINEETIFIDAFGGSGLLSETCKRLYPKNRVIWNDYDDFNQRLKNIAQTEQIRAELYEKVGAKTTKKGNINKFKPVILEILQKYDEKELDWLQISIFICFQFNFMFSFAELEKRGQFYNRITKTPLDTSGNYLRGVERVQMDFRELLDQFREVKNKVLILDPPYLKTEVEAYKEKIDFVDFLELAKRIQRPFMYFTNEKSELFKVLKYLQTTENYPELKDFTFRVANESTKSEKGGADYIIYPNFKGLFEF